MNQDWVVPWFLHALSTVTRTIRRGMKVSAFLITSQGSPGVVYLITPMTFNHPLCCPSNLIPFPLFALLPHLFLLSENVTAALCQKTKH